MNQAMIECLALLVILTALSRLGLLGLKAGLGLSFPIFSGNLDEKGTKIICIWKSCQSSS